MVYVVTKDDLILTSTDAQEQKTVTATVRIVGIAPNVSNIRCCYKDADASTYSYNDCFNENSKNQYAITGGKYYDMMCNFTVIDVNGWQDMMNGWVNVTWHHSSVAWNIHPTYDKLYANATCKNISSSASDITINYECGISGIRYWADAGRWNLLVNLSNGMVRGFPMEVNFTIANVTSIWQSTSINFGSMVPGTSGSQSEENNLNVNATTNNTGNTAINIEVNGGGDYMTCGIGRIPITNIKYDLVYRGPIANACGNLTSQDQWECDPINLQDCNGSCSMSTKLVNTYWGIIIPESGVGGSCTQPILILGVQANP